MSTIQYYILSDLLNLRLQGPRLDRPCVVRGLQRIRESLASRRPLRERYRQAPRLRKGLGKEVDLRNCHIQG